MSDKLIWQLVLIAGLTAYLTGWLGPADAPPLPPEQPPTIPDAPPLPPEQPDPPVARDLPDLPRYFRDWAATVRGDDSAIIRDTDQWRTAFEQASQLLIGGTDYVAVDGRTEQIDFILAEAIGIDNQPFTDELRDKLAAALETIADTVVVDDPDSVVKDANYRPQIAITSAVAIIPSDTHGEGVTSDHITPVASGNSLASPGVHWVTFREAYDSSMAGEWVWVQLEGSNCPPCRKLDVDVFPRIHTKLVACKLTDVGAEWKVRQYPTSALIRPGWRVVEMANTPATVVGVEWLLERWHKLQSAKS